MKNQRLLLLSKVLTIAIMILPILLFLYWITPTEKEQPLPSYANEKAIIECGFIEYIESDRDIRGSVITAMGGSKKHPRKSLKEWKLDCPELIFIDGSRLVNKNHSCYIANKEYYRIILPNSDMEFRSKKTIIPDVFTKCPFSE